MTVRDTELLLALRDEPELLAVADALSDVLSAGDVAPRGRRRTWFAGAAAVAVAIGAVTAGALLVAGNRVEPRLVDRALAAVGDAPVLHVVIRQQEPSETTLVELSTGRRIVEPRISRTEIWFDKARSLEHTITHTTGQAAQNVLSTPEGVTSESGPVWTCARIAAHPVEATKARVSCNFSGDNGTTPRHVPEPPPTLDPALAGFVDGYREALASGAARKIGEGTVEGRHVYWLEFSLPDRYRAPDEPPSDLREQVAVASDTYRPLLVRTITNGVRGDYEVLEIGTVARVDADFSEPTLVPPERPTSTSVRVTGELELAGAARVLGTPPLWLGPEIGGLKLAAVQRQEVTSGYGPDGGVPPQVTPVVALIYGDVRRRHPTEGSLVITESTAPFDIWAPAPTTAPAGYVGINAFGWGYLRVDGMNVELKLSRFSSGVDPTVVAAARSLTAFPSD
jgi:hypothetical protein